MTISAVLYAISFFAIIILFSMSTSVKEETEKIMPYAMSYNAWTENADVSGDLAVIEKELQNLPGYQRYHIRNHFIQLLKFHMIHSCRDVQVENVQTTKEDGGKNGNHRTPDGKNNQRDGQPASVTEGIVGPDTAGIVHDIIKAAQTCDHTAHTGSHIFIPCHTDTGCICRSGILSHGS